FSVRDRDERPRYRAKQRLDLTQDQETARLQRRVHLLQQLFLEFPLEIDRHVPAEDHVLPLGQRIVQQIQRPELDEPLHFFPQAILRSRLEPPGPDVPRRLVQRQFAVLRAPRGREDLAIYVRREDAET